MQTRAEIEAAAKAIGRTATDLSDEPCDASCETDGGTCICVDLHFEQAKAALKAAERARIKTDTELWMFKINDLRIGHSSELGYVYIGRNGEGGLFSESEFVEAIRTFVSERL